MGQRRRRLPWLTALLFALPCLLVAAPVAAAVDITWPEALYNPRPLPDDVLLPLPCGGVMAFRWVATPTLDDAYPVTGSFQDAGGEPRLLVGKYEVTRWQAQAVRAGTEAACPPPEVGSTLPQPLTWFQAIALAHRYSLWLTSEAARLPDCAEDASPCLPRVDGVPAFVRLPLEREWEYVSRGGPAVDAADFSAPHYPMAEGIDAHAWHRGNAAGNLQPIGTRAANPLGLHDVYGNIAELMLESDRSGGARDPTGATVVRGGSVGTLADALTIGYREPVAAVALEAPQHSGARLVASAPIYTSQTKYREAERRRRLSDTASPSPPPPVPVQFVGHLRVRVNVPADIRLDGQPAGRATPEAPLEIEGIAIGERTVEVSASDYHPVTHSQAVVANRWMESSFSLEPTPYIEPEMVSIEGGCFEMGSPGSEPERSANERLHRICVDTFEIGKYEVTFDEYERFAGKAGRRLPDDEGWGRGRRPVIRVNWEEALAYAAWLSEQTGQRYRLPTEAEWEYAARAGTTTPFWTGTCIDTEQVNYDGKSDYNGCSANTGVGRRKTVIVGSLPSNPWGLHEVLGNVWEWTCTAYAKYYDGSENSCAKAGDGRRRGMVIRGSSWNDGPTFVRSAFRGWNYPGIRFNDLGFRLARELPTIESLVPRVEVDTGTATSGKAPMPVVGTAADPPPQPLDPSVPAANLPTVSAVGSRHRETGVVASAPGTGILELSFQRRSWLEVHDARGERLAFGLAKAGSRWSLEGRLPFRITLGDSGAAALTLDGRIVPPAFYGAEDDRPLRFTLQADDP